jgi:hypothetical protein
LSYLTHVGKEGVERADYGAIPRVLERSQRVHVLIDDDRFAAFRQRFKKLGQCRPVTIEFYDEGPAADVTGLDCCAVMLVVLPGSPVPNCLSGAGLRRSLSSQDIKSPRRRAALHRATAAPTANGPRSDSVHAYGSLAPTSPFMKQTLTARKPAEDHPRPPHDRGCARPNDRGRSGCSPVPGK